MLIFFFLRKRQKGFKTPLDLNIFSLKTIETSLSQLLENYTVENGIWRPKHCRAQFKIAILIAYRDRPDNLKVFLGNMHTFLTNQSLHYGIYLIEPMPYLRWNKGNLYNAGYMEALKDYGEWDCFFLHDIDMLPEDTRNFYTCDLDAPVLYAANLSQYNYQ